MKKGGGRRKGSKFELDISKQVAQLCGLEYGREIRRTPNSGALITRADLWVSVKQRHKFPYFVEMKNRVGWTLEGRENPKWEPYKWFQEAESKLPLDPDYDLDSVVILIFKRNGIKPLVMMRTKDINLKNEGIATDFYLVDNTRDIAIISWKDFESLFL